MTLFTICFCIWLQSMSSLRAFIPVFVEVVGNMNEEVVGKGVRATVVVSTVVVPPWSDFSCPISVVVEWLKSSWNTTQFARLVVFEGRMVEKLVSDSVSFRMSEVIDSTEMVSWVDFSVVFSWIKEFLISSLTLKSPKNYFSLRPCLNSEMNPVSLTAILQAGTTVSKEKKIYMQCFTFSTHFPT